jgi:hypothetical protein
MSTAGPSIPKVYSPAGVTCTLSNSLSSAGAAVAVATIRTALLQRRQKILPDVIAVRIAALAVEENIGRPVGIRLDALDMTGGVRPLTSCNLFTSRCRSIRRDRSEDHPSNGAERIHLLVEQTGDVRRGITAIPSAYSNRQGTVEKQEERREGDEVLKRFKHGCLAAYGCRECALLLSNEDTTPGKAVRSSPFGAVEPTEFRQSSAFYTMV